jgi:hypothetical protein
MMNDIYQYDRHDMFFITVLIRDVCGPRKPVFSLCKREGNADADRSFIRNEAAATTTVLRHNMSGGALCYRTIFA